MTSHTTNCQCEECINEYAGTSDGMADVPAPQILQPCPKCGGNISRTLGYKLCHCVILRPLHVDKRRDLEIRQQAARECAEIVEALRQQSSDVEARGAFAEARNAILRHFGIEGK